MKKILSILAIFGVSYAYGAPNSCPVIAMFVTVMEKM